MTSGEGTIPVMNNEPDSRPPMAIFELLDYIVNEVIIEPTRTFEVVL